MSLILIRRPHPPVTAVCFADEPRKLELRQRGRKRACAEAGRARKLVRRRRALREAVQHARRGFAERGRLPGRHGAETKYLEHVRRRCERRRALAQETIRPRSERAGYLAWNGKDLAPVLESEVRGDQRAASLARLDDHGRRGEAGDDSVPRR